MEHHWGPCTRCGSSTYPCACSTVQHDDASWSYDGTGPSSSSSSGPSTSFAPAEWCHPGYAPRPLNTQPPFLQHTFPYPHAAPSPYWYSPFSQRPAGTLPPQNLAGTPQQCTSATGTPRLVEMFDLPLYLTLYLCPGLSQQAERLPLPMLQALL